MSESLFVELVDPSSCSINKVKWLQCHKMSLSKQSLITCLFEWAWAVSSETRGSWIIKSALDCGDTHWSFYYMVPTDKADDIVGREFFSQIFHHPVYTMYQEKLAMILIQWFGNSKLISLYTWNRQCLWCGACIGLSSLTCVYMWQSYSWNDGAVQGTAIVPFLSMWGAFNGHILISPIWLYIMDP